MYSRLDEVEFQICARVQYVAEICVTRHDVHRPIRLEHSVRLGHPVERELRVIGRRFGVAGEDVLFLPVVLLAELSFADAEGWIADQQIHRFIGQMLRGLDDAIATDDSV